MDKFKSVHRCCRCDNLDDVQYIPSLDDYFCSQCVVDFLNDILSESSLSEYMSLAFVGGRLYLV